MTGVLDCLKRNPYKSPDTVWVSLGIDSLIAQSPLETVQEGEEWVWED